MKKQSEIRLNIIAFRAALFAKIRELQKLISKYEQSPTPSHPKSSTKKLSLVTVIIINIIKKQIYKLNFPK
jgi:hypothetical protein